MNYPEDFDSAVIDLEIDFGDKGGIQRFKTVGDIGGWLNEEQEFWSWINRPPTNQHHSSLSNMVSTFESYYHDSRSQLTQNRQRWDQIRPTITQLLGKLNADGIADSDRDSLHSQIKKNEKELQNLLDNLKGQLDAFIKNKIINARQHISRLEPAAQFIKELAEKNSEEAFYALDQILLEEQRSGERRRVEYNGRMMAALYLKNLNRKVRPDQTAFKTAVVNWSKELADFKSRYEDQEREFSEISDRHSSADRSWQERSDQMAEEFAAMRERSEKDLQSLTDTYETHMELKGPLLYWRGKRREHLKAMKKLRVWAIISGVFGFGILLGAAWLVLPENHPADTIPWRQIGFFVLTSTFVLWLVKLLVKLLLSHIHLHADAKEREVMISTFMALIRRPESAQNLKREDIAIVLAPIFKPSTTGVIKDDGGPTSLGDFIGRLSGK